MKQTHFGFSTVAWDQKQDKVNDVFAAVAKRYDIMNDLMSLGIQRIWKRQAVALMALHLGDQVLDLAGGTGDMTRLILPKIGAKGQVVLADINSDMLAVGKARLLDQGIFRQVSIAQVNAENLPYAENTFDHIMIAFGLRNVRDQMAALESMYQVLKPGGRLTVLEFSTPIFQALQYWYDLYSFSVLPWLGACVANDARSYQYLAESIRCHPNQETLLSMLSTAGFEDCRYANFSAGIVACHQGFKY
jgi:demethylmenaquinone methyltransferase / 2-methoxy-6-polyprenyl-1,4-benzoquinol methylase